MAGKSVKLVGRDGFLAAELTYVERVSWKSKLYEKEVPTRFDHRLVRAERRDNRVVGIFVNELTQKEIELFCDQLVVEHGTIPEDEVFQGLRAASINDGVTDIDALLAGSAQISSGRRQEARFELHRIGDAVASRNIQSAVLDAFRLCRML
ncbi:putative N-methylproline demethylase [Roseovarius sp. A-2]|nr:putative N-methylproline demethylase [Roseovarius sp. A-2]